MKGGRTPIHIQRWAPADYHADEHVKLLKARRDYRTLTFYRHFLDLSFASGGDLPADPEALAAVVEMPRKDVEAALSFCLGRLIVQDGDRLFQKRVRRDVIEELEFREEQREHGRRGGRPKKERPAFIEDKGRDSESETPPAPAPAPAPSAGAQAPEPFDPPAGPRVVTPAMTAERQALKDARRAVCDELARVVALSGGDGQRELARASRTPGRQVIVNPESCGSLPWLQTTLERLTARRFELEERQAEDGSPPAPPLPPPDPEAAEFFDAVQLRLVGAIDQHAHATWIRPLEGQSWRGDTLVIRAPNEQFREWVTTNYAKPIARAIRDMGKDGAFEMVVAAAPVVLHAGSVR